MSQYIGRSTRRNFLAAAAGLGLAGGLFTDIRVASAQSMTGAPPEVDRLSIRVVTDSYNHQFAPSGKVGDVVVQRYSRPPSRDLPRTLQNEWGLSLHLESARGSE